MDTWVRTLSVAIASVVAGFLLSNLLGTDVAAPEAYADLVTEIAESDPVEAPVAVVPLVPRPTPVVLPFRELPLRA